MNKATGTKLVRESEIEAYLVRQVKKAGGACYKWVSPGCSGVPDRIVILHGVTSYVEVKAPGGKLTALQERQHQIIREAGAFVTTVWSREGVDLLIKEELE